MFLCASESLSLRPLDILSAFDIKGNIPLLKMANLELFLQLSFYPVENFFAALWANGTTFNTIISY
jgi:hypothetical protein